MKITGSDGSSLIKELLQRIQQEQGALKKEQHQAQAPQAAPQGEKVEISSQAREIHRLKSILSEMPEVRDKKIEEIRSLIMEGSYKIDMKGLTDKIIESLLLGDL